MIRVLPLVAILVGAGMVGLAVSQTADASEPLDSEFRQFRIGDRFEVLGLDGLGKRILVVEPGMVAVGTNLEPIQTFAIAVHDPNTEDQRTSPRYLMEVGTNRYVGTWRGGQTVAEELPLCNIVVAWVDQSLPCSDAPIALHGVFVTDQGLLHDYRSGSMQILFLDDLPIPYRVLEANGHESFLLTAYQRGHQPVTEPSNQDYERQSGAVGSMLEGQLGFRSLTEVQDIADNATEVGSLCSIELCPLLSPNGPVESCSDHVVVFDGYRGPGDESYGWMVLCPDTRQQQYISIFSNGDSGWFRSVFTVRANAATPPALDGTAQFPFKAMVSFLEQRGGASEGLGFRLQSAARTPSNPSGDFVTSLSMRTDRASIGMHPDGHVASWSVPPGSLGDRQTPVPASEGSPEALDQQWHKTPYTIQVLSQPTGWLGLAAILLTLGHGLLPSLMVLRVKPEEALDDPNRARIVAWVRQHEGAGYRDVLNALGLSKGQVEYHIRVLERTGYLRTQREGRRVGYYCTSQVDSS